MILGSIFGAGIGLCVGIFTNKIARGLAHGAGVGLVFGSIIKKVVKRFFKYASLSLLLMIVCAIVIFLSR